MDIFFREIWKDLRLVYKDGPPTLSLPSRFIDEIWTPDLYFPNGKDAKFHTVTVPNRRLKLYQDGTVIYSIRYDSLGHVGNLRPATSLISNINLYVYDIRF